MSSKTPISTLQELTRKDGLTPEYTLVGSEIENNEPIFIWTCSVGDQRAEGRGRSKKDAKHQAARNLLVLMGPPFEDEPGDASTAASQQGKSSGAVVDDGSGNPIGELQEYTQKKGVAPPVYDVMHEQGPAHAREFVCEVKLGSLKETGVGKSKKAAKRSAAKTMLASIKVSSPSAEELEKDREDTTGEEEEEDEEDMVLAEGRCKMVSARNQKFVSCLSGESGRIIRAFVSDVLDTQPVDGKTGEYIGSSVTSMEDYPEMLSAVASIKKHIVEFMDVPFQGGEEKAYCLVCVNTKPLVVCQGAGESVEAAQSVAAHNALYSLALLKNAKS